jgi:hypothetical protein
MVGAKLASVLLAHHTASACPRQDNGIVRPKDWAVARLRTSVQGLGGSTDCLPLVGEVRVMTVSNRRGYANMDEDCS